MRKIKKIHFWIGVITSIFLLIESVSGIYMYFQEKGEKHTIATSFSQPGSGGSQSGTSVSGARSSSQPPSFNQSGNGFSANRGNFQKGGERGGSFFTRAARNLHSGIVGLIAGFGLLILTASGLTMSAIIWKANLKKRKLPAARNKATDN